MSGKEEKPFSKSDNLWRNSLNTRQFFISFDDDEYKWKMYERVSVPQTTAVPSWYWEESEINFRELEDLIQIWNQRAEYNDRWKIHN